MDRYVGKRLDGRYELREIIGVGGMAYVYKAYDTIDDNVVAVKILKDEYLHNEEFSRRFKNESKAIAILSHRNIVRVNDVSFGENLQYIVMEYIDGITLKEYIEQRRVLQWKEVVHFIEQILHALQHAHDKGIVHQDVKPQNIMLLSDGTIKVTDFGIARFSRSSVGQQAEQSDKAIGSVHYISPEQARAEMTDEKSDIYSIGVMMYEMLTGRLPFESDNAVSVAIMQMQSVAERPTRINPDIPEGLEEITLKAMQKDPLKRYQSAAEMLYDIDEFKNNPSIRFEYQYLTAADETLHVKEAIDRIRKNDDHLSAGDYQDDEVEDDVEEEEEEERRFPIIPILAGLAGAVALVALVILGIGFISNMLQPSGNGKDELIVPDLIGQNYNVLRENGQLADYKIVIEEKRYGEGPEGTIFDQSPAQGRLIKKDQIVKIKVSLGDKDVVVPSIAIGIDKESAKLTLESKGFVVELIPETSDTISQNGVIALKPEAGTSLKKGSLVTVIYSSGPEPLKEKPVPTVAKYRTLEEAMAILEEAGFVVKEENIIRVNDAQFAPGFVVDQSPAGGEIAEEGSEVVLTVVSDYKDATLSVPMPSDPITVDYKVYIDGVEKTTKTGVSLPSNPTLSLTFSEHKASYVVRIDLARTGSGNYKAYAQYTINGNTGEKTENYVNKSIFQEVVTVPNVIGQTRDVAENALKSAGFIVSVKDVNGTGYVAGTVITQTPVNTTAMTGSTVEIGVATGKYASITVPVDMPPDTVWDVKVYVDTEIYKDFTTKFPNGLTFGVGETMSLTLDAQKESYKVDIRISEHGAEVYTTWKSYMVDGINGTVTAVG